MWIFLFPSCPAPQVFYLLVQFLSTYPHLLKPLILLAFCKKSPLFNLKNACYNLEHNGCGNENMMHPLGKR